ncbi:MAG: type III sulfide quinone reductase, selenoprotein subtype [Acidimicrobiales bacterium]
MKSLLILGAGTAGTMVANKLRPRLDEAEWTITVVDQDDDHIYQPGLLFLPFGHYSRKELTKPRRRFLPEGVQSIIGEVDVIKAADSTVTLTDGRSLAYDQLVIASGTHPTPEETPGLGAGEPGWYETVFDFYSMDGAEALRDALARFEGGKVVVNITELPIKCPVAPLEFTFLADSFFADNGMRDKVDLTFVTPLPGAFTKPVASKQLGTMLEERDIALEADFFLERVDGGDGKIVSYDEREIDFDLLVTVPVNMGAAFVGRSGLGDELRHVPVDKHTFLSTQYDNVFAIGDAANLPTSKAGSVAHFAVDVFVDNFLDHIGGRPMTESFDGHANCFIESGSGKGLLIDFNYDTEPLTGSFPLPVVGPMSLLKETRLNHLGKLAFRWIYWHLLLRGRPLPVPTHMSMTGKQLAVLD